MFKSQVAGDVDVAGLVNLTNPQLAALYRELTGATLKKFEDKTKGIARVAPVLEAHLKKVAPEVSVAKIERPKGSRRRTFNFDPPAGMQPKPPREGTKLRQMVEMLLRPEGATFEQLMAAIGWNYKNVKGNLWNVVNHCGYGLSEDAELVIRIRG